MKSLDQIFREALEQQQQYVMNLDLYTERNPEDIDEVSDELELPKHNLHIDRKSYSTVGPGGGNPNANIIGSKQDLTKWLKEVYSANDPEVYSDVIDNNGEPKPWKEASRATSKSNEFSKQPYASTVDIDPDIALGANVRDVKAISRDLELDEYDLHIEPKLYKPTGGKEGGPRAVIIGSKANLIRWLKEVYYGDPSDYHEGGMGSPSPYRG